MTPIEEDAGARQVLAWRNDPGLFARDVLGFEPWDDEGHDSQASVLRSVPRNRRIATRSGHKTGKSRLLATVALWAFALFPGARAIMTAPTGRQIGEVLWREVSALYRAARKRVDLGGQIHETWSKGLRSFQQSEVFGISTDETHRFSGISAPMVVYLVDEGPGVSEEVWRAIFGNVAGGAWIITAGNPVEQSGQFFRCFHEESHLWRRFLLSSERTPTARGIASIPGLSTREWVDEMRARYFPHDSHPEYAARVRGDFPAGGAQNVIALSLVERSEQRARALTHRDVSGFVEAHALDVGVDVARFGDDMTCAIGRRGPFVLRPVEWNGANLVDSANRVVAYVEEHMTPDERRGVLRRGPARVRVDTIGVGAGLFDALEAIVEERARKTRGIRTIEPMSVNVAEASDASDDFGRPSYSNLRAEVWHAVGDFLATGFLPADVPKLRADLLAPHYGFDLRGRRLVEPKDAIKKRIGRSPDTGDALALCVYSPPEIAQGPVGFRIAGL